LLGRCSDIWEPLYVALILPLSTGKGQLSEQAMNMPTLAEKAALLGLSTPGKAPPKKKGKGDRIVINLKATSYSDQEIAPCFTPETTPAPLPPLFDCR
jgi:hypothetical protein